MGVIKLIITIQIFTIIYNVLMDHYFDRIMLDYDYDDPDIEKILYRQKHNNIASMTGLYLINFVPIFSQICMALYIYAILNLDVRTKLFDNLTIREWLCNEMLGDQKKNGEEKETWN